MKNHKAFGTTGLFPQMLIGGGSSVAEQILRKRGFNHTAIIEHWDMVLADDELCANAFPVKLNKMQGYNVLVVKVHPAYRAIFIHQADMFIARLNAILGKNLVQRIKIT
jgi:hypothetical protein